MMKCSACGKSDIDEEAVELWGSQFCSMCFVGQAKGLHRELKPEDIELLKVIGKELAGLLPGDLVEMILVGYYQRATGKTDPPPREETLRVVGEMQRLTAFASFKRVLSLLKTWKDVFSEFVESQEEDIREKIRKLTETP